MKNILNGQLICNCNIYLIYQLTRAGKMAQRLIYQLTDQADKTASHDREDWKHITSMYGNIYVKYMYIYIITLHHKLEKTFF